MANASNGLILYLGSRRALHSTDVLGIEEQLRIIILLLW